MRISLYHRLQSLLVAAVAAIMVGMVAAQQVRVAAPERAPVGVGSQSQYAQGFTILFAELAPVAARLSGLTLGMSAMSILKRKRVGPERRIVVTHRPQ